MPASLVDTNVWLAATFEGHPCHQRARQELWAATPADPWLWCRATQQSFLRLASTAAVFRSCGVERATNADARAALEQWLVLRQVAFVEEPPGVMAHWARLAAVDKVAPKLWMDAYLAAFAMAAGVLLVTLDQDFIHFEQQGLTLQLLQVQSP